MVHFLVELKHLIGAAFGNLPDLKALVTSIGYKTTAPITNLNETVIMLVVLALIDVVIISKLRIIAIVGGFATFSRMNLDNHPDQPERLSHVNESVLKVKLATAIIGVSSIHLLKIFMSADNYTDRVLIAQTVIHIAFLLSPKVIAYTDKLMSRSAAQKH